MFILSRIKFMSNISVQVFVISLKIQMQVNHLKINMRYNQHCVLLLITFILLIYHLQQVTIFSKTEDKIFRTGRRVLLKNRMNSKQFRIRTNTLKKVVDAIAGRQPNFRSKKMRPTSIESSNTLVYNRIDKAGSTTLISLF